MDWTRRERVTSGAPGGDALGVSDRPGAPGELRIDVDADGPPPTPHQRRRRRRLAIAATVVGVALAIVVVVALALSGGGIGGVGAGDGPDDSAASDDPDVSDREGRDPPADETPDAEPPQLDALELDALEGVDGVYARLLTDVDDAERVMIGFQSELQVVFGSPVSDPTQALQEIRTAAEAGAAALDEVRSRLDGPVEDGGAEVVRVSYLRHLDAWAQYMEALVESPDLLIDETESAPYDVEINASAAAFALALEARLPTTADARLRDFADALLDRGFRTVGGSMV